MLSVIESFEKLKGFPIAKYKVIKSESDFSSLKFPFWLKVDISGHKLELGAVIKSRSLEEARKNLVILRKKFPTETIIAQEQIEGIEMILGLKEDKVFGKLLMIGFGGTFTEIVRDVSFRALPIDKKEIETSINELKMAKILTSRKKYAVDKLISMAENLSNSGFREADLNPVVLNEKGAFIVDARVSI